MMNSAGDTHRNPSFLSASAPSLKKSSPYTLKSRPLSTVVPVVVVVEPASTIVEAATQVALYIAETAQDSYIETVAEPRGVCVDRAQTDSPSVIVIVGAFVPQEANAGAVLVIVAVSPAVGIRTEVPSVHCKAQVVVSEQMLMIEAPKDP